MKGRPADVGPALSYCCQQLLFAVPDSVVAVWLPVWSTMKLNQAVSLYCGLVAGGEAVMR